MRPLGLILAILAGSLIVSYPVYALATAFSNSNTPQDIFILTIVLAGAAVIVGMFEEYSAGVDVEDVQKSIDRSSRVIVAAMAQTSDRSLSPAPGALKCASCSAVAPPGSRFCTVCGGSVSAVR
jgi:hypothetical protein